MCAVGYASATRRRVVGLHAAADFLVFLEEGDLESRAREAASDDEAAHSTSHHDGSLGLGDSHAGE